jgi:mRNA-degrading endonuclease RelE of RelBE toxin-antitoxin system
VLNVLFVETPTFTHQILMLLSDDEYTRLQEELAAVPDRGDLIRGGGGIRKLRWAAQGRGKSGGIRIIYYWMRDDG